jgi:hypothetical protein
MNSCETWYYVLMDLPLYVVKDVTRLPFVPERLMATLKKYNILQVFGCFYVKCIHESFE